MSRIGKGRTWRAAALGALVLRGLTVAIAAGGAIAHAQVIVVSPTPPPPPPPSRYRETFEDLSVKVMGGRLTVKRVYDGARWVPLQAMADLFLSKPVASGASVAVSSGGGGGGGGGGGSVASVALPPPGGGVVGGGGPPVPAHAAGIIGVSRMGNFYKGQGGGVYAFGKRDVIRATEAGFQWQNRDGFVAEYDKEGRFLSYRNRNAVRVSVQRDASHRITGVFDTLGRQVLWLEYAGNLLSAIRDSTNRRVQYEYTANRMTKLIDVRGNPWTYEYTANGSPRSRTDPEGQKLSLSGCAGWVWEGKDQDGIGAKYKCSFDKSKKQFYIQAKTTGGLVAEAWYGLDGLGVRQDINGKTVMSLTIDGRTRTSVDRNGGRNVNAYDEFDNLLSRTHPDGSTEKYSYAATFSSVTQKVDENGTVTAYEYDGNGNVTRKTDAVGRPEQRVTVYTYDSHGNRTSARRLGDARTQEAAYAFTYDDSGNLTSVTSPEGGTTRFTHDVMGNVLTRTDPRSKVWTYTYGASGLLTSTADPLGNGTSYGYDKIGNRTSENAGGRVTLYVYDRQHRISRVIDPAGKTFNLEWSADGLVTKATDEDGKSRTYQYDLGMRLLKVVDGNGNVYAQSFADDGATGSGGFDDAVKIKWPTFEQQYQYDRRNRVTLDTAVLDGDSISAGFIYDGRGNIVRMTDASGKSSLFEFDAYDRTVKETTRLGQLLRYEYDNHGNGITIIDTNDGISRFEYDRQNRLVKEIRPLGQETRYAYDPNGNLVDRVDPKGQRTHYAYDDANRLIGREHFATATSTTPAHVETFSHDADGNVTAWSDGVVSGSLTYDALGRLTSETVNYGGFALAAQYGYRANGTLDTFTGPDGISYTYLYDADNQLAGVQVPSGALTVTESLWTEPKTVVLPGGSTKTYGYDGLLNLKSLQVKGPAQNTLLELGRTYDIKKQAVTQASTGSSTATYTYDDDVRLTGAQQSSAGARTYTLDGMGNRVADGSGTWTYDKNNRLLSRPGVTYSYDDNGNLVRKVQDGVERNYFYDQENRLVRVEGPGGAVIARYGYDPFDRRLYKEVGGVRTYFFHSDLGLIAEVNASGAPVRSYGYHPDSFHGTLPLFTRTGASHAFYHLDHLGTPVALTTPDGRVVWSAAYDAFGRADVQVSEVTSHLRLPGQYWDAETGFHYNDRRYYDPETGRYLTEDPIGLEGGLNRYVYVDADPVNSADPTGECLLVGLITGAVGDAAFSITKQLLTKGCFAAISWKEVAIDAAIGAATGALTCGLSKLLKFRPRCGINSFPDDTLVHTRGGLVPLRDVKVGDEVLSRAEWRDGEDYQEVEAILAHEGEEPVVVITLESGEKIETTEGHPFRLSGRYWEDAGRLVVGDELDLAGRGQTRITGLERTVKRARFVNLAVASSHTFFVGKDGVLVHNSCWSSTSSKTPPKNAFDHWKKHGTEFPELKNAKQYAERAKAFNNNPPPGSLTKTRPNGDVITYDPASNTFGVRTSSGTPKTMFRPDPSKHGHPTNLDYFNAQ